MDTTVYHPDGGEVMLTHYCTMGNQPRMRTSGPASANQLTFAYVDATNMRTPDDAHMHGVRFTFVDHDHFTQEWTMMKDGKTMPATMHFERTK